MNAKLIRELNNLPSLDRPDLIKLWRQSYQTEPPNRIRNRFLICAIAYRMQEQAYGGLKPVTKHFITRAITNLNSEKKVPTPPSAVKPGTRLIREWHGVMHEVIVLERSVTYKGQQYKSLTEVAKIITGVKWSGPSFFGLKSKRLKRSTV